jgi:hypothetical protein
LLVSPGEPDPTLFAIPDDYVERPTADIMRDIERKMRETIPAAGLSPPRAREP